MNKKILATAFVDSYAAGLDKGFSYIVPDHLHVKPAMRITVPFGRANKLVQAFVVDVQEASEKEIEEISEGFAEIKSIHAVIDENPILPEYMLGVISFLREEFFCTYREALSAILPGPISSVYKKKQPIIVYEATAPAESLPKRATKQRAAVNFIAGHGPATASVIAKEAGASAAVLRTLEEKGFIKRSELQIPKAALSPKPSLNAQQQEAIGAFLADNGFEAQKYLLHGITGSGKTNAYFEMMDAVLALGRQCLILVPEIALTPQLEELVRNRFGYNVALVHSKLAISERIDAFMSAFDGSARIVLGARSAAFSPFRDLGLIVVDEEHEPSYKSSSSPRYEIMAVVEKISELTGARVVISSATPSTESYSAAMSGKYKLLELSERFSKIPLPSVEIIDMRDEIRNGNRSPLSFKLQASLKEKLDNGEQSLLFLNRRGYSTYVFCRKCGYSVKCENCDITLTYHKDEGSLVCHYCGYSMQPPSECPQCSDPEIRYMGAGTEQIQAAVGKLLPGARILRLDSDTARARGNMARILSEFNAGSADILVGTQMAVKGLDYQNVALVGIVLADVSLNFPDLNSPARTFQLIEQASGRAGRRDKPGQAILQTYSPGNATLLYAAMHDYKGFYTYDIGYRQERGFPPYTEIIGIFIGHEDLLECRKDAEYMHKYALSAAKKANSAESAKIYSPAPAQIKKLKGKFIYHILACYPPHSDFKAVFRQGFDAAKAPLASSIFVEINPAALL
ncbi:MAG: primosomal protein N' [Eubacteriaceae bacterium]|nr:primosomal protein N' [Eubacteriaceae bacterium]